MHSQVTSVFWEMKELEVSNFSTVKHFLHQYNILSAFFYIFFHFFKYSSKDLTNIAYTIKHIHSPSLALPKGCLVSICF